MNLQKYLERIKLSRDEIEVGSLGSLKKIQEAHLKNIPWENLNTVFGEKIQLDM